MYCTDVNSFVTQQSYIISSSFIFFCSLHEVYLNDYGDCWPLDEEQKSMILKNCSKIVDVLDVDDDLFCEMLSRHCLTLNQLIIIENTNDRCERNKKLLNILMRSSKATLKLFIECLEITQRHIVPLFSENTGKKLFEFDLRNWYCNSDHQDLKFETAGAKNIPIWNNFWLSAFLWSEAMERLRLFSVHYQHNNPMYGWLLTLQIG